MEISIYDGNVYTKAFILVCMQNPLIAPYLFYLHKRSRIKYNFQCAIGEQGTGKSIWEMIQGLILDPTFDITRVVFSTINLLDALDMLEDRTFKGRFILWDDAGVGLPSDEWYLLSNKAMHSCTQTVRTLHPTIAFTAPNMEYIDKKTRMVFTSVLDCYRNVDNRTDIRIYTAKRLALTAGIVYRKFSVRQGFTRLRYGEVKVEHLNPDMIPDMINEYIKISDRFKFDSRRKNRELMIAMQEKKYSTDGISDYSALTLSDFQKRLIYDTYVRLCRTPRLYQNKSKNLDTDQIMLEFSVDRNIAFRLKRFFDSKKTPLNVKEELGIEEQRTLDNVAEQANKSLVIEED